MYLQTVKAMYHIPTTNIVNSEKLNIPYLRLGAKQGYWFLPFLFIIELVILTRATN